MTVVLPKQNGNHSMEYATIPYDVESIRQHFPALRGEKIPLNNATGSLVYDGAVKA